MCFVSCAAGGASGGGGERHLVSERQRARERQNARVNSGPTQADTAPRLGNWKANWGYKSTQVVSARDRFTK